MEYRFEDILEIRNGKNQKAVENPEGRYPIYGSGGVIGYADDYICEADTIIIGRKGSINNPIYASEPFWNVDTAFGLSVKKDFVLPRYLYYFCKRFDFEKLNKTVTIPSLTKSDLLKIKINLPVKDEQQAIIDRLMKIESIMEFRKTELDYLDVLIKARFVELFGDPQVNPFGWDTTLVGDVVASCEAGWSGNGTQREKEDGEIAVLKVSAVTKGYFIPEECKVLDDQDTIKKYVYPQAGDLLFSRANTREMVGATAVITQDYPEHILPDKLWKIRFLGKANVWYMKYVLSSESIRSIFSSVSTGTSGSMFNVSMDKFKSIRVPLPPIERQQQFAIFVAEVDKSKVAVQRALDETQILFNSLMQKYFG